MGKITRFTKLVALATLLSFSWQSAVGYAFPSFALFPTSVGRIQSNQANQETKNVILLLNAHTSSEAQRNIAELLSFFQKQGVDLIGLEGASEKIDGRMFRNLPFEESAKKATWRMVEDGVFTGAEYFYITAEQLPDFFGLEDPELYFKNRDAFVETLKGREAALPSLQALGVGMGDLKRRFYSNDLAKFDKTLQLYREKNLSFPDYLWDVLNTAKHAHVGLTGYGNVYELARAIEKQGKSSAKGLRRDLEKLTAQLPKGKILPALIELVLSTGDSQVRSEDPFETYQRIYSELTKLVESNSIRLADYPHLQKYVAWLQPFTAFDSSKLFDELEALIGDIYETLARSENEKTVVRLASEFETLNRMLMIQMTQNEWLKLASRLESGSAGDLSSALSFMVQELKDRAPRISASDMELIERARASAVSFYELAEKRNHVFSQRIVRTMERKAEETAVVVVGGFHEAGLKDALHAEGVSTVVIAPKMNGSLSDIPYIDRMMGKPTDLQLIVQRLTHAIDFALKIAPGMTPSPVRSDTRLELMIGTVADALVGKIKHTESGSEKVDVLRRIAAQINAQLKSEALDFQIEDVAPFLAGQDQPNGWMVRIQAGTHVGAIQIYMDKEGEASELRFLEKMESPAASVLSGKRMQKPPVTQDQGIVLRVFGVQRNGVVGKALRTILAVLQKPKAKSATSKVLGTKTSTSLADTRKQLTRREFWGDFVLPRLHRKRSGHKNKAGNASIRQRALELRAREEWSESHPSSISGGAVPQQDREHPRASLSDSRTKVPGTFSITVDRTPSQDIDALMRQIEKADIPGEVRKAHKWVEKHKGETFSMEKIWFHAASNPFIATATIITPAKYEDGTVIPDQFTLQSQAEQLIFPEEIRQHPEWIDSLMKRLRKINLSVKKANGTKVGVQQIVHMGQGGSSAALNALKAWFPEMGLIVLDDTSTVTYNKTLVQIALNGQGNGFDQKSPEKLARQLKQALKEKVPTTLFVPMAGGKTSEEAFLNMIALHHLVSKDLGFGDSLNHLFQAITFSGSYLDLAMQSRNMGDHTIPFLLNGSSSSTVPGRGMAPVATPMIFYVLYFYYDRLFGGDQKKIREKLLEWNERAVLPPNSVRAFQELGAFMYHHATARRSKNKVTLLVPNGAQGIEEVTKQMFEESGGVGGKELSNRALLGRSPTQDFISIVTGEPFERVKYSSPGAPASDRVFLVIEVEGTLFSKVQRARIDALRKEGHPVFVLRLPGKEYLAAYLQGLHHTVAVLYGFLLRRNYVTQHFVETYKHWARKMVREVLVQEGLLGKEFLDDAYADQHPDAYFGALQKWRLTPSAPSSSVLDRTKTYPGIVGPVRAVSFNGHHRDHEFDPDAIRLYFDPKQFNRMNLGRRPREATQVVLNLLQAVARERDRWRNRPMVEIAHVGAPSDDEAGKSLVEAMNRMRDDWFLSAGAGAVDMSFYPASGHEFHEGLMNRREGLTIVLAPRMFRHPLRGVYSSVYSRVQGASVVKAYQDAGRRVLLVTYHDRSPESMRQLRTFVDTVATLHRADRAVPNQPFGTAAPSGQPPLSQAVLFERAPDRRLHFRRRTSSSSRKVLRASARVTKQRRGDFKSFSDARTEGEPAQQSRVFENLMAIAKTGRVSDPFKDVETTLNEVEEQLRAIHQNRFFAGGLGAAAGVASMGEFDGEEAFLRLIRKRDGLTHTLGGINGSNVPFSYMIREAALPEPETPQAQSDTRTSDTEFRRNLRRSERSDMTVKIGDRLDFPSFSFRGNTMNFVAGFGFEQTRAAILEQLRVWLRYGLIVDLTIEPKAKSDREIQLVPLREIMQLVESGRSAPVRPLEINAANNNIHRTMGDYLKHFVVPVGEMLMHQLANSLKTEYGGKLPDAVKIDPDFKFIGTNGIADPSDPGFIGFYLSPDDHAFVYRLNDHHFAQFVLGGTQILTKTNSSSDGGERQVVQVNHPGAFDLEGVATADDGAFYFIVDGVEVPEDTTLAKFISVQKAEEAFKKVGEAEPPIPGFRYLASASIDPLVKQDLARAQSYSDSRKVPAVLSTQVVTNPMDLKFESPRLETADLWVSEVLKPNIASAGKSWFIRNPAQLKDIRTVLRIVTRKGFVEKSDLKHLQTDTLNSERDEFLTDGLKYWAGLANDNGRLDEFRAIGTDWIKLVSGVAEARAKLVYPIWPITGVFLMVASGLVILGALVNHSLVLNVLALFSTVPALIGLHLFGTSILALRAAKTIWSQKSLTQELEDAVAAAKVQKRYAQNAILSEALGYFLGDGNGSIRFVSASFDGRELIVRFRDSDGDSDVLVSFKVADAEVKAKQIIRDNLGGSYHFSARLQHSDSRNVSPAPGKARFFEYLTKLALVATLSAVAVFVVGIVDQAPDRILASGALSIVGFLGTLYFHRKEKQYSEPEKAEEEVVNKRPDRHRPAKARPSLVKKFWGAFTKPPVFPSFSVPLPQENKYNGPKLIAALAAAFSSVIVVLLALDGRIREALPYGVVLVLSVAAITFFHWKQKREEKKKAPGGWQHSDSRSEDSGRAAAGFDPKSIDINELKDVRSESEDLKLKVRTMIDVMKKSLESGSGINPYKPNGFFSVLHILTRDVERLRRDLATSQVRKVWELKGFAEVDDFERHIWDISFKGHVFGFFPDVIIEEKLRDVFNQGFHALAKLANQEETLDDFMSFGKEIRQLGGELASETLKRRTLLVFSLGVLAFIASIAAFVASYQVRSKAMLAVGITLLGIADWLVVRLYKAWVNYKQWSSSELDAKLVKAYQAAKAQKEFNRNAFLSEAIGSILSWTELKLIRGELLLQHGAQPALHLTVLRPPYRSPADVALGGDRDLPSVDQQHREAFLQLRKNLGIVLETTWNRSDARSSVSDFATTQLAALPVELNPARRPREISFSAEPIPANQVVEPAAKSDLVPSVTSVLPVVVNGVTITTGPIDKIKDVLPERSASSRSLEGVVTPKPVTDVSSLEPLPLRVQGKIQEPVSQIPAVAEEEGKDTEELDLARSTQDRGVAPVLAIRELRTAAVRPIAFVHLNETQERWIDRLLETPDSERTAKELDRVFLSALSKGASIEITVSGVDEVKVRRLNMLLNQYRTQLARDHIVLPITVQVTARSISGPNSAKLFNRIVSGALRGRAFVVTNLDTAQEFANNSDTRGTDARFIVTDRVIDSQGRTQAAPSHSPFDILNARLLNPNVFGVNGRPNIEYGRESELNQAIASLARTFETTARFLRAA